MISKRQLADSCLQFRHSFLEAVTKNQIFFSDSSILTEAMIKCYHFVMNQAERKTNLQSQISLRLFALCQQTKKL